MQQAPCIPPSRVCKVDTTSYNHPTCLLPQTKDTLTLRASAFGSKCELPEKFLKKVADAGVLEAVAQFAKYKEDRALKKSDGAKRNRLTGASIAMSPQASSDWWCAHACASTLYLN